MRDLRVYQGGRSAGRAVSARFQIFDDASFDALPPPPRVELFEL
jgi:hypothetical protein